jgi:hypothetical protein
MPQELWDDAPQRAHPRCCLLHDRHAELVPYQEVSSAWVFVGVALCLPCCTHRTRRANVCTAGLGVAAAAGCRYDGAAGVCWCACVC